MVSDYTEATNYMRLAADSSDTWMKDRALRKGADEITTLRQQLEQAEARADACEQQAKIWKQEARTQSAIVAEIYQELTGSTGEPGDWNGARPLGPAILRKQAEAVEAIGEVITKIANNSFSESEYQGYSHAAEVCADDAQRLHQQADELDKAGGSHEA